MVNEVEVVNVNAETGKEFVFTIEDVISDVTLSQDGREEREDEEVMIVSGASVKVSQMVWKVQVGTVGRYVSTEM